MFYSKGQLFFPEDFRSAHYTISPFSTSHLKLLDEIQSRPIINEDLIRENFDNYEFVMSGKDAISKALSFYQLHHTDEVYIVTPTGNKYVSSCVTSVIEKYCKWSREFKEGITKLIVVVHEFGIIYEDVELLKKHEVPIIEDFAMSMFSRRVDNRINGDFAVYSLPKFFPVQFGGILRYNASNFKHLTVGRDLQPFQLYLTKICGHFLAQKDAIISKRKDNYEYFKNIFMELGINSRFDLGVTETPSVFMFSTDYIDLDALKFFLQAQGIECSKFYGENSFFLPVHQELTNFDIEYIANLVKHFIYENK